ncbi:MAG: hypothetical protein HYS81_04800 [Candidatus Aenigmatarchaeota archaeon]|nr:MAG: hypothetical protein HYS81_04800 [Candidatus Aenigmarchaeota archaeon]
MKQFVLLLVIVFVAGCIGGEPYTESIAVPDHGGMAAANESVSIETHSGEAIVRWEYDREASEWKPRGDPPECPAVVMQTPVDIDIATSILYPGQERTGDYKPHGGFRFDNSDNAIEVRAPFDGYMFRGSRSLSNGEIQYSLDVVHPCGIVYRLGHILELPPKWAAVAEKFREPTEGDTRTTEVEPVRVETGEVLATKVGLENNVFVDWGVYDLRQRNEASQDPAWAAERGGEHASYALCWFELLPPDDEQAVRALPPADGTMGTTSDYC